MSGESIANDFPEVVELNVGGVFYSTSLTTLIKEPDSLLGEIFTGKNKDAIMKDSKGRFFLDRDGVLFRYILDYLRNQKLVLPENFHEKERLKNEAEHFNIPDMVNCITTAMTKNSTEVTVESLLVNKKAEGKDPGCIMVGYRGTFAFGRDGLADVKFRKLSRILVSGKISMCRQAFGDTLNESRDPDRGTGDRYTARMFLKHTFLEQAYDDLYENGFRLVGSVGSATNSGGEIKPGMDSEESKWNHYNEFIFVRP
jgi:hypothetical protein